MRRSFSTNWGTRVEADGRVRFRIWSSGGSDLKLRLDGVDHDLQEDAEGWCELVVDGVAPGTPYGYVLDSGEMIPDPAARAQQGDVHGPSIVVDPHAYAWRDAEWRGRAWEETVYYEMHVGTFTPEGTFRAAISKLPHLRDLGITAIEIMPVGQFSGNRGWGYDGVLIYAPHSAYGTPDDMKAFIDAAHGLGLSVVLDVIYNHFGPDGNYLPVFAPDFFHPERSTPWGGAIAYEKRPVRQFFIDNALYWLEEFHLDGLRLDAIDHIVDDQSELDILVELAQRVRQRITDRPIHLTTEDNRNITALHERGPAGEIVLYSGEWNDDFHNVTHSIATGETEGYYRDFSERHWWKLARCLATGFSFQGEPSSYGEKKPRGVASAHLPPTAFVDFIQNHDQVGNRAFGERLVDLSERSMVETLLAMLLLSPHIPLLFMGEEFGETRPFVFFTDFHGELADAVREGRRREFAHFSGFNDDQDNLRQVPDPNAPGTFEASKLNWDCVDTDTGRHWMQLTRRLLRLRHDKIVPLLANARGNAGTIEAAEDGLVSVSWRLGERILHMSANLDDEPRPCPSHVGDIIHSSNAATEQALQERNEMPPHAIVVTLASTHQSVVTT